MKNIFQFIKENETRNEDDVTQEEFLEALLEIEEELDEFELEESFELDESIKKHMSPYDAREFLKKHKAHNKDFHGLPSSSASAMHDKAKELKYKKSRSASGSTGRMFHAALQKHADSYKGARESVELDEKAPKIKGDWLKQERERNNKHDAAMAVQKLAVRNLLAQ